MNVAKTKGVGFLNVRGFAIERFGEGAYHRILERLTPGEQRELSAVIAVGWYPLELYARLIRALDETFGEDDRASLIFALGRYEAERDLTTIHRMFLRFFHPAFIVEKTGSYWRRFHDTGVWELERTSATSLVGLLKDWGYVDVALCQELVGYIGRCLELAGAERVVVDHTRCRARGEGECRFDVTFGLRGTRPGA